MSVRVENRRQGKLRLAGGLTLLPGENVVANSAWETCSEHTVTLHYLHRGELRVLGGPVGECVCEGGKLSPAEQTQESIGSPYTPESPPLLPAVDEQPTEPESPPTKLEDMRAKDAIDVVSNCTSPDRLLGWLSVEARTTVLRAINRRLEELKG